MIPGKWLDQAPTVVDCGLQRLQRHRQWQRHCNLRLNKYVLHKSLTVQPCVESIVASEFSRTAITDTRCSNISKTSARRHNRCIKRSYGMESTTTTTSPTGMQAAVRCCMSLLCCDILTRERDQIKRTLQQHYGRPNGRSVVYWRMRIASDCMWRLHVRARADALHTFSQVCSNHVCL
jgi:hypothetical protein